MQYWDLPECSICHERLSHSLCTLSQCGHVYHENCIKQWISNHKNKNIVHNNCPLCRKNITKTGIVSLKYETVAKKIGDSNDDQINFLEGEIKHLRGKIINIKNENSSLNLLKESLNNENNKLSSKYEFAEKKITDLTNKIKDYELQIASLGATNKRLSESLDDYKSKVAKNDAFSKYLKNVTEKERDVLSNLSKDEKINVLLQRVIYLSRSNKELSLVRDKWKKSYNDVNMAYSELQSEYLNLATSNSSSNTNRDDLINFKKVRPTSDEFNIASKRLFDENVKLLNPQNVKLIKSPIYDKRDILQQLNFIKPIKRQQGIKNFFDPVS